MTLLRRAWITVCLALCAAGASAQLSPEQLTQARLTSAQGSESVTLPHVLRPGQFAATGSTVTYRLSLSLAEPPEQALGLYIRRLSLSGRVSVNGHDLGSCATGPLNRLRCLNQPLWTTAGPSLWHAGENTIEVQVWATDKQFNGLSPLVVGPAETVYRGYYAPDRLWRYDLVRALKWSVLTAGVMSLLLGTVLLGERLYLWFGLLALFRSVSNFSMVSITYPGDPFWTNWFFNSARLICVPLTILTLIAFFGRPMPRLERLLIAYALLIPLVVAMGANALGVLLALVAPLLLVVIGLLAQSARWVWDSRKPVDILLFGTVLILLSTGVHDLLRLTSEAAFLRPVLLPYSNGLLLLVMGGLIVHRLGRALATAGSLNTLLAERVAAHESDLERKHKTIVELERSNARVQERERLLQDLHDGLGSNLATARIRLSENSLQASQLREVLDECIDDMRLLLDTSAPDGSLADALGDLRYRMNSRLGSSALTLDWRIELQGLPDLPATARLQLLRIVQEGLTNAIRHARATRIEVGARYRADTGEIALGIRDNGCGYPTWPAPPTGRGLVNMRHRAAQLGAHLQVQSGAGGTAITLTWTATAPQGA